MNAAFLLGIFVLSWFLQTRRIKRITKLSAISFGIVMFLYANYGAIFVKIVHLVPNPSTVLGPIVTYSLSEHTTTVLMRIMNSVLLGPITIALIGFSMNRLLTHPELTDLPYFQYALPNRDPWQVVITSSMLGTVFHLGVVALGTERLILIP